MAPLPFYLAASALLLASSIGALAEAVPVGLKLRPASARLGAPSLLQTLSSATASSAQQPENSRRPWRPADNSCEACENMCINDKLVPEIYLLGAPKAATTTLAMNLMAVGVNSIHDTHTDKEFHWFDGRFTWKYNGTEGRTMERWRWLYQMPPCPPETDHRTILADYTPDYLRMVPLPPGYTAYGKLPPWGKWGRLGKIPPNGTDVVTLPPLMRNFYGAQARKLKFILMLRNPLKRMQSAWYHSASFNFTNLCIDCRAPDFQTALREHLTLMKEGELSDWIWTGMYSRQLEGWLKDFDASQFMIVPTGYLSAKEELEGICTSLSSTLGYAIDCKPNGETLAKEWSHPHPALDDDAPQELRLEFETMMSAENVRLARTLDLMRQQGAVLVGGRGADVQSKDDAYRWLVKGW